MNTQSNSVQTSRLQPSILWPVVMIVVGMLALWLPFQLVHAYRSEGVGPVVWKVLVALIFLAAGIYFLMHPFLAVTVVTLALAVFFLVEGLVDVFSYFATRKAGASYWILLNGIISIILAAMIWRHWPTGSLWVLGVLVGIGLLMTGTSRLMMALAIRAYVKQSDRETGGNLRAA